jgi:hypothetical protein
MVLTRLRRLWGLVGIAWGVYCVGLALFLLADSRFARAAFAAAVGLLLMWLGRWRLRRARRTSGSPRQ